MAVCRGHCLLLSRRRVPREGASPRPGLGLGAVSLPGGFMP